MKKKRIISALMAVSMCVSAMPMAVCAESNTTTEYPEFTQKFLDECLLNPEESEENRLIHNLFKGMYDWQKEYEAKYGRSYYDEFLGVYNMNEPYYLEYAEDDSTVPGHDDIKYVQCIEWGNWTSIAGYNDNPYITKEEFYKLSYEEMLITVGKIFDETGEFIAPMAHTELATSPYYITEDGKCYNWNGEELDVFNGKVMNIYCNPEKLEICDGKSVYKYSDVYDGDPDTALRADFYKYLEDNNAQQVFSVIGGLDNYRVYRNKDSDWCNHIEDLSDELFITDLDGNVIPNDPNLLQVNVIQGGVLVYVYKVDDKYIFEDELGNRIVFSSYNDETPDSHLLIDFFHNHSIDERYPTDNVVETYVADTNDLKLYNTNVLSAEKLTGDANLDGDVDIADAVFIMQCLSNPDEYKLSEQGLINADYNGDGGVTAIDALEIQISMIS